MRYTRTAVRLTALLAALALAGTACGSDDSGGGGSGPLKGVSLTVGSKEFTEQLILGQITIQALENAGASVEDQTGITGTTNVRKALTSGEVDLYWEYTGTGWTTILGHEVSEAPKDDQALFDAVAKEDLGKGIKWFALSSANDTYAIATASGGDVTSLSEYASLANSDASAASLCAAAEFLDRDDGWPGVEKAYGFDLPTENITEVDLGIVFTQVPSGEKCHFGEVFATDGRIPANDMLVLDDDKDFFVKYDLAVTMNADLYDKNPKVAEILTPIAEKMTTEELQKLNAQKDVDGIPPEEIAKTWLADNGFV
ncbi:MAG: glycine betaine ABC transporter substrate-binding protein [Nocardioidaceae bacterium]